MFPPNPVELLQQLIRFDTTNPPGNEAECIAFIRELLAQAGIESTILARTPERPNLVARLPGEGSAPPLLLYGHVDVVTTAGQSWQPLYWQKRLWGPTCTGRWMRSCPPGRRIFAASHRCGAPTAFTSPIPSVDYAGSLLQRFRRS